MAARNVETPLLGPGQMRFACQAMFRCLATSQTIAWQIQISKLFLQYLQCVGRNTSLPNKKHLLDKQSFRPWPNDQKLLVQYLRLACQTKCSTVWPCPKTLLVQYFLFASSKKRGFWTFATPQILLIYASQVMFLGVAKRSNICWKANFKCWPKFAFIVHNSFRYPILPSNNGEWEENSESVSISRDFKGSCLKYQHCLKGRERSVSW